MLRAGDPHHGHQAAGCWCSASLHSRSGRSARRRAVSTTLRAISVPEWRLSRLEREHDRDEITDDWVDAYRRRASCSTRSTPPASRTRRTPTSCGGVFLSVDYTSGSDRDLQHQGPASVEVRQRARMLSIIHRWRSAAERRHPRQRRLQRPRDRRRPADQQDRLAVRARSARPSPAF